MRIKTRAEIDEFLYKEASKASPEGIWYSGDEVYGVSNIEDVVDQLIILRRDVARLFEAVENILTKDG